MDATIEVEYVATCDAAKEAIWIQKFLSKVSMVLSILSQIPLYYDHNGAIAQVKEPRSY